MIVPLWNLKKIQSRDVWFWNHEVLSQWTFNTFPIFDPSFVYMRVIDYGWSVDYFHVLSQILIVFYVILMEFKHFCQIKSL